MLWLMNHRIPNWPLLLMRMCSASILVIIGAAQASADSGSHHLLPYSGLQLPVIRRGGRHGERAES